MDKVKEMILQKGTQGPGANNMSKYLEINAPVITMDDMIDQMKEIILEMTFSRHFSLKDSKLADLVKGKSMIGLYVWMCAFCFYQAGSGDQRFWDRFANIASKSILMWADIMTIMTSVQRLRDDGTHLVRQMDKHTLEVQLDNEDRKFRRKRSEMAKLKNFNSLNTDMAWGANLSENRSARVLYSLTDPNTGLPNPPWLSFEIMETKTQWKYLHEILNYVELFIVSIVPLLTKLKETTTQIQQSTSLNPNSEIDVILGMIILDKLDLVTLSIKTLKLHVKEIRTTIRVCYEFCRYLHDLGNTNTKSFEDIEYDTISQLKSGQSHVIVEPRLTIHEASLKYNSQTYPDILQIMPLRTTEFSMILQDLKDVFDLDALSTTNENDM